MTPSARVKIFAVVHRQGCELVTAAGPDRPVYVGSQWMPTTRPARICSAGGGSVSLSSRPPVRANPG